MNTKLQLKEVREILLKESDQKSADFFQKAVPGKQKVYGVKTPVLNEIARKYKDGTFEIAESLWEAGALEEKIIAIKILEKTGKQDPERLIKLFKKFSKEIDNWAVCDGLGMQFLRQVVKSHADEIFAMAKKMNASKDPWQRRLSLVMVEWYTRDKKFHPQIKMLVKGLEKDSEYYVKKAVSWINRNLDKGK